MKSPNQQSSRTRELFAVQRGNAKLSMLRLYALRRWLEGAISWKFLLLKSN